MEYEDNNASTRKSTPNVSHTFLTNLKATGEVQRVPVGESLYLHVSAKGKKTWYLKHNTLTPDGKRKQNIVSLGQFFKMDMRAVRRREGTINKHNARTNVVYSMISEAPDKK